MSLNERLEELRQRVERQWEIHVKLHLDSTTGLADEMLEGTYRLAQESIVNAARHADASVIDVTLSAQPMSEVAVCESPTMAADFRSRARMIWRR